MSESKGIAGSKGVAGFCNSEYQNKVSEVEKILGNNIPIGDCAKFEITQNGFTATSLSFPGKTVKTEVKKSGSTFDVFLSTSCSNIPQRQTLWIVPKSPSCTDSASKIPGSITAAKFNQVMTYIKAHLIEENPPKTKK